MWSKGFFYQNEHGSRVFFDSLGPPWPKHSCYHGDNHSTAGLPIGHSSQKHPQSKFTLEQLERRHKALLNARTAREKKERATERRSKKALSEAKATRAEKQRKKAERKVDPKHIAMMETMEAKRKKQRKLRERVKMKRISNADCDLCALKAQCCPKDPQRKILRSIHEGARDMARDIAKTEDYKISCKLRKKVEMLFAHLKRILRLGRLRLRGPCGAKDEFHLAATAQNLRNLAKLIPMPEAPQPA